VDGTSGIDSGVANVATEAVELGNQLMVVNRNKLWVGRISG
jgi:hypothetical protein